MHYHYHYFYKIFFYLRRDEWNSDNPLAENKNILEANSIKKNKNAVSSLSKSFSKEKENSMIGQ